MLNRMTLAMSSIVVLIVAASSFATQPTRAQSTAQGTAQGKAQSKADECLGRPGATAPKGSHWYYRLERPSGRRCWYLGPVNQKVARAAPVEQAVRTAPAEQVAPRAFAEQRATPRPRHVRAN